MQRNFRVKTVLLFLFILLLTAACNQEGPEGGDDQPTEAAEVEQSRVQFVPFIDDALGLTVQYPANWISHASISGATFATSQSVIDAESLANIGEEAFVVVIPGEIDYFNFQTGQTFSQEDVLTALATYKTLLEREGQEYVTVEPPEAFTSNDQRLALTTLRSIEDGEPLITVMAVVMGDSYMALVSAASLEDTAEEMRPIFDRIIESIELRAPGGINTESE